jgi:O-antigen ligase
MTTASNTIGGMPASAPAPLPGNASYAQAAGLILLAVFAGVGIALAEENALYLGLAIVACLFIMYDFRVGVALVILILPISSSSVFPHQMLGVRGLNPLNLLLFCTMAACFFQSGLHEKWSRYLTKPLLWLYIIPILVAGALGARHVDEIAPHFFATGLLEFNSVIGYVRDVVVRPMFFVLFALLLAVAVARSRDPEKFVFPILLAVCIMCLLAMAFTYLSGYSLAELASSSARSFFQPIGIHANDLGRLYAVAYALLLFTFAQTERADLKMALLIAMVAVVVALTLTFSRGSFVGFIVVNLLFLISRRNAFGIIVFCMLAVAALFLAPGAVYERLSAGLDGNLNQLSAGRTEEIWLPLVPELLKSPFWGSGLMSITWADAMRHGAMLPVTHAHNAYLQTYMDMGLIGLGLLCAYFAHVWSGFRRLARDQTLSPGRRGFFAGAAAGLVSLMIAGVAGGGLTPGVEQTFLWMAIGMMYGEYARKSMPVPADSPEPQARPGQTW